MERIKDVSQRLATFKRLAFENAVRLFADASILFENGRYPSAFALAATSFEELGKMHFIDRGCDSISLNGLDGIYQIYFKGSVLKEHRRKQEYAFIDALDPKLRDSLFPWFEGGGLEAARRTALYVEMVDDAVASTNRITKAKAKQVLDMCYSALLGSAELAFNGFDAMPTAKRDWLAEKAIEEIEKIYTKCRGA